MISLHQHLNALLHSLQMIETQAELRDAQETVKDLQGKILSLESQRVQTDDQHEEQKNKEDQVLVKIMQIKCLLCCILICVSFTAV